MDIYYYGQAMFKIKGKSASLVIDPYDPNVTGLKLPKPSDLEADAVLVTHNHPDHNFLAALEGEPLQVLGPGEYEIKGVSINGISVFHDQSQGSERGKNTVYHINIDGLNIAHLGDLGHVLTEGQTQEIGDVDILMIPVGGNYTIDAKTASEVVSQLEPSIIIPMHYGGLPGNKLELAPVQDFLKEMGGEAAEPQSKLSITKDKLPEEPQVVVLSKS